MRIVVMSMTVALLAGVPAGQAAASAQAAGSAGGANAAVPAVPAKAVAPLKIVALGDSLTSGHRLPRGEAYPAVLQSALSDAGLPFSVVNHGVSGDTTAGALR